MNKDKSNERSSNFELLRILTMFLIVVFHITVHCVMIQLKGGDSIVRASNDLFNTPIFYRKLFLINGVLPLGNAGNLIFLLISGYFLIGKPINIMKISKKLLLHLLFAWIILIFGSTILFKLFNGSSIIKLMSLPQYLTEDRLWYVGYYFGIVLIAYLFLNKWLSSISQKDYSIFLIILFALSQFCWIKAVINDISIQLPGLLVGVFSFSMGGYIKKYDPFKKFKVSTIVLLMSFCYIVIYISSYNITQRNIINYISNNIFLQKPVDFEKINIIVIVLSICLFELFSRIKMPNSKVINYIGSSTFMIYLLHDNELVYGIWGMRDWTKLLFYSPLKYILYIVLYAFITFIICFIFYNIFLLIEKLLSKYKYIFFKR